MNFTIEEALSYMKERINPKEIFFAQTDEGILIFQDGKIIELKEAFIYREKKFLVESDLEKEFCNAFGERYVDLTYCIENEEDYSWSKKKEEIGISYFFFFSSWIVLQTLQSVFPPVPETKFSFSMLLPTWQVLYRW